MGLPDRPREAQRDTSGSQEAAPRFAGAKRILAVAGGKGGVGKSTVAVNLALGLERLGYRVGLLDADIHGPNVPLMLGVRRRDDSVGWESMIPLAIASSGQTPIPALERYGIRVMSVGLLAGEDQALLADNAPLAGLLVRGLLSLVDWGHLDVLVLDLPPGTGEPLATLLHSVRLDGVILIVTPQDVARLDAGRALASFQAAGVPILGVVENMAYLVCPRCGERIEVFHRGLASRAVADGSLPLLAEIPLDPVLSAAADTGRPVLVADPAGPQAAAFLGLSAVVATRLGMNPASSGDEEGQPAST